MIHMSRNVELFNLCSIRIGILGRAVQDNDESTYSANGFSGVSASSRLRLHKGRTA